MTRVTVRCVTYNVLVAGEGPAVLLLHGFTGSSASWSTLAERLTHEYQIVAVDLLGHGESDAPGEPERYAFSETVRDLAAIADALNLGRFHLVGYSMGGRVALHVALAIPERIASLVLMSTSPGIEDPAERAARRRSDVQLAVFLLQKGVHAFVDRWEKLPLFQTEQRLPLEVREAVRKERLGQRAVGLAGSLLGAGAGMQDWLLPELKGLYVPTLLLAGELDTKYTELAYKMAAALPHRRLKIIPDAGHAVHRERPDAVVAALIEHLEYVEGKMSR